MYLLSALTFIGFLAYNSAESEKGLLIYRKDKILVLTLNNRYLDNLFLIAPKAHLSAANKIVGCITTN